MICVIQAGTGYQAMIEFRTDISGPMKKFKQLYDLALSTDQLNIEAICISTSSEEGIPSSRMVNIKYIEDDNFIFFTNYNSQKSVDLKYNKNISCVFYWPSINKQIRINGIAKKINASESDIHFNNRDRKKNALAISSNQSKKIISYEKVLEKYHEVFNSDDCFKRPDYWGGFKIIPYYYEFWLGNDSRINKREVFELSDNKWNNFFLES
jgi:pyridoxamine 5'-phosphate oxidase